MIALSLPPSSFTVTERPDVFNPQPDRTIRKKTEAEYCHSAIFLIAFQACFGSAF
jgi:hypothetical protein